MPVADEESHLAVGSGNVASILPENSLLKYRNLHRVQLCVLPFVLENCTECVKVPNLTEGIFRGAEKISKIFTKLLTQSAQNDTIGTQGNQLFF